MQLTMELKLRVFRRDKWICRYCHRPVVFHPAMRLLEEFVKEFGYVGVAYYHRNWRHADAPLLDYLGAVVDHIQPGSKGGESAEENLGTACNKCNMVKTDKKADCLPKARPVKSKFGDPMNWDGLTSLFMSLAKRNPERLSPQERRWLVALLRSKTR